MCKSKPVNSLLNASIDIIIRTTKLDEYDAVTDGGAVGGLSYLAMRTRPDPRVAVSVLGAHVVEPTENKLTALEWMLKY